MKRKYFEKKFFLFCLAQRSRNLRIVYGATHYSASCTTASKEFNLLASLWVVQNISVENYAINYIKYLVFYVNFKIVTLVNIIFII